MHVSGPVERLLKAMIIQGGQSPAKHQKMWKKFGNLSVKTIAKRSMYDMVGLSFGLCQEIPQKKPEHALCC